MRFLVASVMCTFALAACAPGDTTKSDAAGGATPSDIMRQTFAGCTWGEVKGAELSVWSYACGPGHGDVRLVADDALPGFAIEGGGARRTVIQVFRKDPGGSIEDILGAVRAASPGPFTASCAFAPSASGRYVLEPTGADRDAWQKSQQTENLIFAPCGPMGVSEAGERTFEPMKGHPDKVVYVDWGSEIQIFDAATLKTAEAH